MSETRERYQLKNKLARQITVDLEANPSPENVVILKPLGFDLALVTSEQFAYVRNNYSSSVIIQKIAY